MSNHSAICLAHSPAQAEHIVDQQGLSNFPSNNISALFADHCTTRDFAHKKHTKAPEGTATGAGTGGVIGGTPGWLAGTGALAIPGVGPFIAAGPILAALSGAVIGATLCGITGRLIGLGIPELEAKHYEGKLQEGNILTAVHAEDSDKIARAREIFETAEASDICTTSEKSAPQVS